MRSLGVLIYIVSLLLFFLPSGAYSLDVYGIEVGNSLSFQGTYLSEEAQAQNPGFELGAAGWGRALSPQFGHEQNIEDLFTQYLVGHFSGHVSCIKRNKIRSSFGKLTQKGFELIL